MGILENFRRLFKPSKHAFWQWSYWPQSKTSTFRNKWVNLESFQLRVQRVPAATSLVIKRSEHKAGHLHTYFHPLVFTHGVTLISGQVVHLTHEFHLIIYTVTFPIFLLCVDVNWNMRKYSYDHALSCFENNGGYSGNKKKRERQVGEGYILHWTVGTISLSKQT